MKKILFSLMAVVMAIGLMGGAFSYFTDVSRSQGNVIAAGTLAMEIANQGGSFSDGPVYHTFSAPSTLAPGDSFTTNPVYLKNTGSIAIGWVYARFDNLVETAGTDPDASPGAQDLSRYLILTNVYESNDGGATWEDTTFNPTLADEYLAFWNTDGASFDANKGTVTLHDLYVARNYGSGDNMTSLLLLNNNPPFPDPALPVGGTAAFKFTFQLDPTVTNYYQGATSTFEVDFIAVQQAERDLGYPDTILKNYMTETLP